MSLAGKCNQQVFGGKDAYSLISGKIASAAPSAGSYPTCARGTMIYDGTNDDWYICTVANTTWVKIYG